MQVLQQRWVRVMRAMIIAPIISFFLICTQAVGEEIYDDLFGVSFPEAREGWVCGRWGAVFHTQNKWKNWERQISGTDLTLSSIYFVDTDNGWAVGEQGIIIHTDNGGKSWNPQKSPVPYFLMDVYFADALEGWIVTEHTAIIHTKDGGCTWDIQFSNDDFVLKAVSFCDDKTGWAVGEYGFIYHTSDGGLSWVHQAGEFGISEETGEIIGGNYLFDVAAIDHDTAWVVGMEGYVAKTTDGGRTWEQHKPNFVKGHLLGIASDKKENITIVGMGTILCSKNGGSTFETYQNTDILYSWLNGVCYDRDSEFIAVGKQGASYCIDSECGFHWMLRIE